MFASKALPCTPVLRLFAEEGLGCDVASGGELHLALHAGFAPERIYLHGNAKSRAELAMAVEAGVGTIVLDNAEEALRLRRAARRPLASACCCGSRPGVDADTHEAILTGQAGSKFGFAPDDARALIADPPAGLEIAGLHMHLGSQLFALEPYRRAIRALGLARRLRDLRPRRRPRRPLHRRRPPARRRDLGRRDGRGRARRARRRTASSCSSPAARSWPTRA